MKFYFRAQDVAVDLHDVDIDGTLTLVWKRGYRRTSTEPFEIKEVRAASPRTECHAQHTLGPVGCDLAPVLSCGGDCAVAPFGQASTPT